MAKPSLIAASNAQNGEICSLILEHFAERRFQLIRFSNQEFKVELKESVRGEHVYILQNIDQNPSEALMELVQLIHCCKLAFAAKVSVIVPRIAGANERDGKGSCDKCHSANNKIHLSIFPEFFAEMLCASGADEIWTIGLPLKDQQQMQESCLHLAVKNIAFLESVLERVPDAAVVLADRNESNNLHCKVSRSVVFVYFYAVSRREEIVQRLDGMEGTQVLILICCHLMLPVESVRDLFDEIYISNLHCGKSVELPIGADEGIRKKRAGKVHLIDVVSALIGALVQ